MKHRMTLDFKTAGDVIVLLGTQRNDIGSSEYLNKLKGVAYSPAPHFDLEEEFALHQLVTSLIKENKIKSAHDISEGGLIITLLESAFVNNKGFEVSSNHSNLRTDAFWLGEAQSRVVVSTDAASVASIEALANKLDIASAIIGKVTNGTIQVNNENWDTIASWKNSYDTAIEKKLA
jgi:phosphoribosylformylglycinamidine synthase